MNIFNRFRETKWFVNPAFDLIFLAGIPTLFLFMYLVNYVMKLYPEIFKTSFQIYFFEFFLMMHVAVGLSNVSLKEPNGKKINLQIIYMALLIAITTTVYFYSRYISIFTTIIFYAVIWHIFLQQYFILQFHKLNNDDRSACDNIIDNVVMIGRPFYLLFRFYDNIYYVGGDVSLGIFSPGFLSGLDFVTLVFIGAFILRQIYKAVFNSTLDVFKILIVLAPSMLSYYAFQILKNNYIFLLVYIRWFHALQYIGWVWFYRRSKFAKEKPGITVPFSLRISSGGGYLILFGIIGLLAAVLCTYLPPLIGLKINSSFLQGNIVVAHLFFDFFLWKAYKVQSININYSRSLAGGQNTLNNLVLAAKK